MCRLSKGEAWLAKLDYISWPSYGAARTVRPARLRAIVLGVTQPEFRIGQIIKHRKNGYRGVIYDVDLSFQQSERWYEQMARSRPPKDQPWYRVLVHGAQHETYVAQRHLTGDLSQAPVQHPDIEVYFDEFRGDHYARTRGLN